MTTLRYTLHVLDLYGRPCIDILPDMQPYNIGSAARHMDAAHEINPSRLYVIKDNETMSTITRTTHGESPRAYHVTNESKTAQALVILTSKDAALPNKWLVSFNDQWTRYPRKYAALNAALEMIDTPTPTDYDNMGMIEQFQHINATLAAERNATPTNPTPRPDNNAAAGHLIPFPTYEEIQHEEDDNPLQPPDFTNVKDGTQEETWIIDSEETQIILEIHPPAHGDYNAALDYAIYLMRERSITYATPAQWFAHLSEDETQIIVIRYTNS